MNPTQEQVMSTVRWVLAVGGSALGVSSAPWWANVSGLVIAAAPFVWGLIAHTPASMAMSVAELKDSRGMPAVKVLVAPTAPASLLALASDTSVPEVVHAATVSPSAPPPKDFYVTSRRES